MRMRFLPLAGLVPFTLPAQAGPNAGGVLLFHANENLIWFEGGDYCGQSQLDRCSDADVRVDGTGHAIVHLLAAFPSSSEPRLAGVTVGLEYDASKLTLEHWSMCADYELPTGGGGKATWPLPTSGNSIIWSEAQTSDVIELGWFVAYFYTEEPTTLAVGQNPCQGSMFADDGVPSQVDPVADLGSIGFNTDGYRPCQAVSVPSIEGRGGAAVLASWPNPLSSVAVITFRVPGSETGTVPVDLSIFDVSGRLMRTLVRGDLTPGDHQETWDARDQSGLPVASGSYFGRLRVGGKVVQEPLVVVR